MPLRQAGTDANELVEAGDSTEHNARDEEPWASSEPTIH